MTNNLFNRYLEICDELTIATRVYKIDDDYKNLHHEKINLNNLKILEFPNLNNPKIFLSSYHKYKNLLAENMRDKNLIIVRSGLIAFMAADIARKLKKPYLSEVFSCVFDEYYNYSLLGKILAPFMEAWAKKTALNADFAFYVTEKYLQKIYPSNGYTDYASDVILNDPDENILNGRINKINNPQNKNIIFGTIGGINNKAKGQHYFIQAMKILRDEFNINIKYELVGGGNNLFLRSQAEKYNLSDKIIFKGELTHDEIFKWLDEIDIYIQPSMQEGLSRALIEAMSRACPAIASSTGGNPELLESAAIFERGNIKSLVNVVKNFINSDLIKHAEYNFKRAKNFEASKLDSKRREFYMKYRDYALNFKGE